MRNIRLTKGEYGPGRRLEFQENELNNAPIVPNPVEYEDLDKAVVSFFRDNVVLLDDNGKIAPTFTLFSNQRFSEYSQTWSHTDEDGNLLMNFKTINRENNPQFGSIHGGRYNIPGDNRFTVRMREILDKNGIECYEITSMSQPVQVDLEYRFTFVTSKYEHINDFNAKINKLFMAKQCYVTVNGHNMPMVLDTINDETNYAIEERKFFVQSAMIKLMAYVIPKDDIKVELKPKRVIVNTNLEKQKKTNVSMDYDDDESLMFKLKVKLNEYTTRVSFTVDDYMYISLFSVINANKIKIRINDEEFSIANRIRLTPCDVISITVNKPRKNFQSELIFDGELSEYA